LKGKSREFKKRDRLYRIQAEPSGVRASVQNLSSPLHHRYVIAWETNGVPPLTKVSIGEVDDLESQALLGFRHPELDPRRGEDLAREIGELLDKMEDNSPDVKEVFRRIVRTTRDSYASEDDRRRIDILFGKWS